MKIGVVGAGYWGTRHARIYSSLGVKIVGIVDRRYRRAEVLARELNSTPFRNYKDLLGKVDGVSIVTPTPTHFSIARDFILSGVHVLVEKPFVLRVEEGEELVELASQKGVIIQVGMIERYNPGIQKIGELLEAPRFLECYRMGPFTGRSIEIGVIMDLMIHDLDVVFSLVKSEVSRWEVMGSSVFTPKEDLAKVRIFFSSGCVADFTASRVSEERLRKIRIFDKNTYFSLSYPDKILKIYCLKEGKLVKEVLHFPHANPLQEELKDFLTSIKELREPRVSGREALHSLRWAILFSEEIRKWKKRDGDTLAGKG